MRTVLIVLFDEVQSLDVTGPLEVFAGANRWQSARNHSPAAPGSPDEPTAKGGPDGPVYRIRTASLGGRPVRTSSGLRLTPDQDLAHPDDPDVLLVPGGAGTRDADPDLVTWLRTHGPRARRLVSVCTGAFLLAAAGLLDQRRVTTHWAYCATLATRFPEITVDPDPIFVTDGNVTTSAGVTAGIDLALALAEDDLGRDAALDIARHLVVFLRRPANQAQFSTQLAAQFAHREPLREVQQWIADHPAADLSVEAPVAELRAISHDPTCRRLVTLKDGRKMTAVQLQAEYLELARKYTEDRYGNDVDDITADVLNRWESVLNRLADDPMLLSKELDWVAKLELLEGYRSRDGLGWDHPRLQLVDLQYSDVRPDRGLYNRLAARGRMVRLTDDATVERAVDHPPEDTRAYLRGRCLRQYPESVAAASWDSVIFDIPGRESLQRVPTLEPLRGTRAHVGDLLDRCRNAAELVAALTGQE